LDPEVTAEVLEVVLALRESSIPLILVTHELGFAQVVSDHIAFLSKGKISCSQPAGEFFQTPATADATRFLSRLLKFENASP